MTIGLFDIIPLKGDPMELPKSDVPHYVIAQEGVYLRKTTLLGEVFLKESGMPRHLDKMDKFKNGLLIRDDEIKIPAHIMAQALDFFRKVYVMDKAEAEVLILYNRETKRYRLMPPYQYVTGASVESIFDPRDIPSGFIEIGTIHSHCMMDAFHSSTDTGDASGFNGIHLTIGKVMNPIPDYAAMIMINKTQWNYDIEDVADISPHNARCPNQWLDFIDSPRNIKAKLLEKGFTGVNKWFDDVTRPRWSASKAVTVWKSSDDKKDSKPWKPSEYKPDGRKDFTKPYGDNEVKLSREIQDWVPAHWLSATGSFDLKPEYVIDAFEDKLRRLREALAERGFELWFDISDSDLSPSQLKSAWEEYDLTEDATLLGGGGFHSYSDAHFEGNHDRCSHQ